MQKKETGMERLWRPCDELCNFVAFRGPQAVNYDIKIQFSLMAVHPSKRAQDRLNLEEFQDIPTLQQPS